MRYAKFDAFSSAVLAGGETNSGIRKPMRDVGGGAWTGSKCLKWCEAACVSHSDDRCKRSEHAHSANLELLDRALTAWRCAKTWGRKRSRAD